MHPNQISNSVSGRFSGSTGSYSAPQAANIGPEWTLGNELQSLEQTVSELRQSVDEVIGASTVAQRYPVGFAPTSSVNLNSAPPPSNSPLVTQLEGIKYRISDATTLLRQLSSTLQLS